MKLTLALAFAITAGSFHPAYPIPPYPLRQLYLESDLIAVVVPGETVKRGDRSSVDVKVKKCIKGKPDGDSIRVYYDPLVICPPSAHFPKGKTVLAFLTRDPVGFYVPFAWSYSTKTVTEAALRQYEDRIAELSRLKAGPLKGPANADVIEWVVKCAEHPATRWEAIYELQGTQKWPGSKEDGIPPIQFESIVREQRERLVRVFLESTPLGAAEAELVEFLTPVKDERINVKLRDGLKTSIDGKDTFLGHSLMDLLARRLEVKGWDSLKSRLYEWNRDEHGERFHGYADTELRVKVLEEGLVLVDQKLYPRK